MPSESWDARDDINQIRLVSEHWWTGWSWVLDCRDVLPRGRSNVHCL
jgi:hypothetical protein